MLHQFIRDFTRAALAAGIRRLDYYIEETSTRSVAVYRGELDKLERSEQRQLFIEADVDGFTGSIFVEVFQPDLYEKYIQELRESALAGKRPFVPRVLTSLPGASEAAPAFIPLPTLLDQMAAAERAAYETDPRVEQVERCVFTEAYGTVTLENDAGQTMTDSVRSGRFFLGLNARDGQRVQDGGRGLPLAWGQLPDMADLARQTAGDAVSRLHATSYPTGASPVVLANNVVCELLNAFLPAFFAKNVQDHMSVLENKLGQQIAGETITLEEAPQLPGGLCSRRFDDEGVPTSAKMILSEGILQTYLYNRTSAAQAGCASSGNGFKPSCKEEVSTGYTNLLLRPGEKSSAELLKDMGDGLQITGVSGVFAGAHPASGEFSLIAHGYQVRQGVRSSGVSQITIAGNFFEMLRQVCGTGSDSCWMQTAAGCIQAPSLYVAALNISGGTQDEAL